MKACAIRMWKEDDAVLSFEWVLLVTLLTIGIVGGIAAARDAMIDELGDVAQAMLSVDQSYYINYPLGANVHVASGSGTSSSEFIDTAVYSDCERVSVGGQGAEDDLSDGG